MVIYFNTRARLMFWSFPGWTWSITFTAKVPALSKLNPSRWSIRGAGESWGRLRLCLLVPARAQRGFSARLFSCHVPTPQPRLSCSGEVGGCALFLLLLPIWAEAEAPACDIMISEDVCPPAFSNAESPLHPLSHVEYQVTKMKAINRDGVFIALRFESSAYAHTKLGCFV